MSASAHIASAWTVTEDLETFIAREIRDSLTTGGTNTEVNKDEDTRMLSLIRELLQVPPGVRHRGDISATMHFFLCPQVSL